MEGYGTQNKQTSPRSETTAIQQQSPEEKDSSTAETSADDKRVHARRRSVSHNDLLRFRTEAQQVQEMVPPAFVQEKVRLWREIVNDSGLSESGSTHRPHVKKTTKFASDDALLDMRADGKKGQRKRKGEKLSRDSSPVLVRKSSLSGESHGSPSESRKKKAKSLSRPDPKVHGDERFFIF